VKTKLKKGRVGWKKVMLKVGTALTPSIRGIAKLWIPAGATVIKVGGTDEYGEKINEDGKARTNKAKVLGLYTYETYPTVLTLSKRKTARALRDPAFVYQVGKTVKPFLPFDEDKTVICGSGIHFFWSEQGAVNY
jgi:hypothetical protein